MPNMFLPFYLLSLNESTIKTKNFFFHFPSKTLFDFEIFRFYNFSVLNFMASIVCMEYQPPSQKHHLSLSFQARPLHLQIVQALPPPVSGIPPGIGFLRNPLKLAFSMNPKNIVFHS